MHTNSRIMWRRSLGMIVPTCAAMLMGSSSLAVAGTSKAAGQTYVGPLATADQIAVEKRALRLLVNPRIKAMRPKLREILLGQSPARSPDGAREIEHALDEWTMAAMMFALDSETERPKIIWHVDDSPHSWFGIRNPGMGSSGDDPNHIYRGSFIDGGQTYWIHGRTSKPRAVEITFQAYRMTPELTLRIERKNGDIGQFSDYLLGEKLQVREDGSYDILVGPENTSNAPNYLHTEPGLTMIAIRNVLSDWAQQPAALSIQATRPPSRPALTDEQMVTKIVGLLPEWTRFWSAFPGHWHLQANQISPVQRRQIGYIAVGSFELADDEAIVITATNGAAAYSGIQSLDPWMIVPVDARTAPVSLNDAQAHKNPDGTVTYVVATKDPGVANWLSTGGMNHGVIMMRWEGGLRDGATAPTLASYKLTKLAELGTLIPASLPRVDSAGRAEQLKVRAKTFDLRLGKPASGTVRANAPADHGTF